MQKHTIDKIMHTAIIICSKWTIGLVVLKKNWYSSSAYHCFMIDELGQISIRKLYYTKLRGQNILECSNVKCECL